MAKQGLRGVAAFGDDAELLGLTEQPIGAVEAALLAQEDQPGAATTTLEIGRRLKIARQAAGMSAVELGAAMGLTKDKVSKVESGKRRLDVVEAAAAATVLGTTVRALVTGRDTEVSSAPLALAARLAPGADADADRGMRARARQLLEVDDLLTKVAGMAPAQPSAAGARLAEFAADRSRFPVRPRTMGSALKQGRDLAVQARELLELGSDAVGDLASLIEFHQPVDVALAPFGSDCDGLCAHSADRALVLASTDFPEGHVRFTLAHELGHHLLGDPREVIAEGGRQMFEPDNTVERRVNAFAGYFLMPEAGVRSTLSWVGHTPGSPIISRHVAALMEHFNVSRQALLYQLSLMGLIGWAESQQLASVPVWRMLQVHADVAPTQRAAVDLRVSRAPQRLVRAARSGAQKERIGLGVLATLLGRPDDEDLWNEVMGEVDPLS
jgi:Zn-dependent peptidase ImmA (M78 family)/transcriptional regulator with XRE-family HTH domain